MVASLGGSSLVIETNRGHGRGQRPPKFFQISSGRHIEGPSTERAAVDAAGFPQIARSVRTLVRGLLASARRRHVLGTLQGLTLGTDGGP
jgi:hypothetical protein